jgi:hypothetical protein
LVGSAQKKAGGTGLNHDVADFISENYHDDKYGNSAQALKKPACKYKATCLRDGVTQPK